MTDVTVSHSEETFVQVLTADLASIASAIWLSVLDAEAAPSPLPDGDDAMTGRTVTACVHITGGWSGAVSVALPASLADQVAATMFDLEAADVSPDDVRDAVGELANIAGGNVKGMIEEECHLSLPIVAEGNSCAVSIPGTVVLGTAVMASDGTPFCISLHARC